MVFANWNTVINFVDKNLKVQWNISDSFWSYEYHFTNSSSVLRYFENLDQNSESCMVLQNGIQ